jgi:proteasome lid subunit RPN8/RPN11
VSLRLGSAASRALHEHLRRAYPEEGCGVLLGRETGGDREVARVIALDNAREGARERRYLIAPEQLLAADREARDAALDVLGIFHSHPDHPAEPSEFDRENAWPWYSYLIVSVRNGEVADQRCWRLREDRAGFDAEPIEPAGEPLPKAGS